MSEEMKLEPASAIISDPLEFYKSLTPTNRETEREMINLALDNNVFPESMRYDEFRGGYRGVMKSTDGDLFYFTWPKVGAFHLVKATDDTRKWEVARLSKGLSQGVDLIRKGDSTDDEDEEEKGKAGPGGGGMSGMPPAPMPEEQNVASQASQMTETHPGGAMGTTPESDTSEARWHGTPGLLKALPDIDASIQHNAWSGVQLMKAWGDVLQTTAPRLAPVDPKLREFCVEVLGKMPSEVDAGPIKLNGMQRAQFNAWLTKSTRTRVTGLEKWLTKANNK